MIYPWKYIDPNLTTRSSNQTGTFPKIRESKQQSIDRYVMQKLIELEQEVKGLKQELDKLREQL